MNTTNNILENLFSNNDANCEFLQDLADTNELHHFNKLKSIQEKISFQINFVRNNLNNNKNSFLESIINEYCIKPQNIPVSFFEYHWQEALNRGELTDISDDSKTKFIKNNSSYISNHIIETQKNSLIRWINYLKSPENNHIDPYLRYWVFKRMLGLGAYNRSKYKFERRNKECTAPFPELNSEALHNIFEKILNNDSNNTPSFRKLYSQEFSKLQGHNERNWEIITGEWIHFPRFSNPEEIVNKIQGKNTGFCIASLDTAKDYLERGALDIFFSDSNTEHSVNPRLVIHTVNNKINEVRGVKKDQNIDQYILPVLNKKLEELADGDKYRMKSEHMQKLYTVYDKHLTNKTLSKLDLRFIYEIDEEIQGFGYFRDARVNEIIQNRDQRSDLKIALDCLANQISFTDEEFSKGNIIYHYGDLKIKHTSILKENRSLNFVRGDFDLRGLHKLPRDYVFPKKIWGNLNLDNLESIPKATIFPQHIEKTLYLKTIQTLPEDFVFPGYIGGSLDLSNLRSLPTHSILPEHIGRSIALNSIKYLPEDLIFPHHIDESLYLNNLQFLPNNISLPKYIGFNLELNNLTCIPNGFKFPEKIGGSLNLTKLKTCPGTVTLPTIIGIDLNLSALETLPDNFIFPEIIGMDLNLKNLVSLPENCKLPNTIDGGIYLNNLQYLPNGFSFPKNLNGDLYLNSLIKIPDNISFPEKIGNDLYLDSIETIPTNFMFPKTIRGDLSLTSLEKIPNNFHLPKYIGSLVFINKTLENQFNIPKALEYRIKFI